MRTLITGATGTIGRRLVEAVGGEVTVLSRDPEKAARSLRATRFVAWDGRSTLEPALFAGVDVVFHLAGEPVADAIGFGLIGGAAHALFVRRTLDRIFDFRRDAVASMFARDPVGLEAIPPGRTEPWLA